MINLTLSTALAIGVLFLGTQILKYVFLVIKNLFLVIKKTINKEEDFEHNIFENLARAVFYTLLFFLLSDFFINYLSYDSKEIYVDSMNSLSPGSFHGLLILVVVSLALVGFQEVLKDILKGGAKTFLKIYYEAKDEVKKNIKDE